MRALEEFSRLFDAGTPIDRDELLARYADIAEELGKCLEGLDRVHGVAGAIHSTDSLGDTAVTNAELFRTLGDFRIVREVGRGGMGIVYEAEQVSLGRRVALKVLPFAATLTTTQLQRFRNEARAAGALNHPHIVPVHSTGVENGIHYLALQFVDGQSLAKLIEALNTEQRRHRIRISRRKSRSERHSANCRDFHGLLHRSPRLLPQDGLDDGRRRRRSSLLPRARNRSSRH